MAGHNGLVGSAIVRNLREKGYNNLVLKSRTELDLADYTATSAFFDAERPDYVVLAAAMVGGIMANNVYRADFIFQNLQIQNNIIHHSYRVGVKKLLFLVKTIVLISLKSGS